MEKIVGIYWFYQISKDRAVYVGSSTDVHNRILTHKAQLTRNKHPNSIFQRTWSKYGLSDFSVELLEYSTADQLLEREQFWVDALSPFCNFDGPVGRPMLGRHYTMSPEHRMKIGLAQKGRKGKPLSQAAKDKVSKFNKGRKHTEEHKRNQSIALRGRKQSPELKAKLDKYLEETRAKFQLILERRLEGASIETIMAEFGLSNSRVYTILRTAPYAAQQMPVDCP